VKVYTRRELVQALLVETPGTQTTNVLQVWLLARQVALVTYTIRREAAQPVHTLRSSVWKRRNGKWLMAFHHGTLTAGAAQLKRQAPEEDTCV